MMIKFLRHGLGDPGRAAAYLINDRDHLDRDREHVEVLRGDPTTFVALARSSPHKYRYSSAVIAWAKEDAPTDQQINDVLNEFELHAHAGLNRNQYHMTAVLHISDDQSKHIHVLFPRIELTSKKSLNVAPPGHLHYFDLLRDYFNHRYQWARPDDPARLKELQLPQHIQKQNAFYLSIKKGVPVKKHRLEIIHQYVQDEIKQGNITDRSSLLKKLSEIGKITRCSDSYITITTKSGTDRLKGEIYESTFNATEYNSNKRAALEYTKNERAHEVTSDDYLERMLAGRAKRKEYNKKKYPDRSNDLKTIKEIYSQKSGIQAAQQSNGITAKSNFSKLYEGPLAKGRIIHANQSSFTGDMSSTTGADSNALKDSAKYSKKSRFIYESESTIRDHPILKYITKKTKERKLHNPDSSVMHFGHSNIHGVHLNERNKLSHTGANSNLKDREFATEKEFTTTTRIGRKIMPYSEFYRKISEQSDRAKQFFEERNRATERDYRPSKEINTGEPSTARYTKFNQRDGATIIVRIKQFFERFISSRAHLDNHTKSIETISTRDAEVVTNQLGRFGAFRRQSRSDIQRFFDEIRCSDHRFGNYAERVQKVTEFLITRKLPQNTFQKRLKAITYDNPILISFECFKYAKQVDNYIQKHYENKMKNWLTNRDAHIDKDYFSDVKRMFKEIDNNLDRIKNEEEYKSLYEIIELANHYALLISSLYLKSDTQTSFQFQNEEIQSITDQFKYSLDMSRHKFLSSKLSRIDKDITDNLDKKDTELILLTQIYNDLNH